MTGRHVTTSSSGGSASTCIRGGFRKISIQTDVSTSNTPCPTLDTPTGMVVSHLGEIALPQAGASELDDPSSPSPLDKVRQRAMYGARVRPLSAPADRFLQEVFIEH